MVAAVRAGQPMRAVARRFGVGVATVVHWVGRAKGRRLDRVDWSDRSSAPHQTRRTDPLLEDRVLLARRDLAQSDLGAIGADAIRQRRHDQGVAAVPSVRTINRILGRRGALDGRPRTHRARKSCTKRCSAICRSIPDRNCDSSVRPVQQVRNAARNRQVHVLLLDEVRRAFAHCVHRSAHICLLAENDDRRRGFPGTQPPQ